MDERRRLAIELEVREKASRVFERVGKHADQLDKKFSHLASGGLSRAGSAVSSLTARVSSLAATGLRWLAGGLLAATAASVAAGVGALKLAGNYEQAEIAFTTMLGSAAKAKDFLARLAAFGAKTPFQFSGLVEQAQRLMAFKFKEAEIIPMLTAIGDAVAAMGGSPELLSRVTLSLGQMKAKGKVSGEEMLQLTEANIDAWGYLAAASGKSVAQVRKESERGALDAGWAIKTILAGMGHEFGGLMEKQSHTLLGIWSNLIDGIENMGRQVGLILDRDLSLKKWLQQVVDSLPRFTTIVAGFVKRIAPTIQRGLSAVGGFVEALLDPKQKGLEAKTEELGKTIGDLLGKAIKGIGSFLFGGDEKETTRKGKSLGSYFAQGLWSGMKDALKEYPEIAVIVGALAGTKLGAIFGPQGAMIGLAVGAITAGTITISGRVPFSAPTTKEVKGTAGPVGWYGTTERAQMYSPFPFWYARRGKGQSNKNWWDYWRLLFPESPGMGAGGFSGTAWGAPRKQVGGKVSTGGFSVDTKGAMAAWNRLVKSLEGGAVKLQHRMVTWMRWVAVKGGQGFAAGRPYVMSRWNLQVKALEIGANLANTRAVKWGRTFVNRYAAGMASALGGIRKQVKDIFAILALLDSSIGTRGGAPTSNVAPSAASVAAHQGRRGLREYGYDVGARYGMVGAVNVPRMTAGAKAVHRLLFGPTPYSWGGSSYSGADCSGSLSVVLRAMGLLSGRDTSAGFAGYGKSGKGPFTIYGVPGRHVWFEMLGRLFEAVRPAFHRMSDNRPYDYRRVPSLDLGGRLLSDGLLFGHKHETVTPARVAPLAAEQATIIQHNSYTVELPDVTDPAEFEDWASRSGSDNALAAIKFVSHRARFAT